MVYDEVTIVDLLAVRYFLSFSDLVHRASCCQQLMNQQIPTLGWAIKFLCEK